MPSVVSPCTPVRVQFQRGGILWIPSLFKISRAVPAKREKRRQEGAASREKKEYTIRDALAMMEKNNRAIMAEMQANMDREWTTWKHRQIGT